MTPDTGWLRGSWLASGPLHSTPLAREMVLPEEAEAERSVSAAGRTQQVASLGFEPGSVDFGTELDGHEHLAVAGHPSAALTIMTAPSPTP